MTIKKWKISKKLLIIALVACVFPSYSNMSVFATNTDTAEDINLSTEQVYTNPTIAVESKEVQKGETVKLNIDVKNNPGIISMGLSVSYDTSRLELLNVEYNNQMGGQYVMPQNFGSPVILNWISPTSNYSGDDIYATLTFKVLNNAESGSAYIKVTYDENDVYNLKEENVHFSVVNGGINVTEEHSYDSTVTKEATCKENGIKTYTCQVCGETYTEEIPATEEHSYNSTVTKEATCTESGEKTYICTVCGDTKTEEILSVGHTYGEWSYGENNTRAHICTICGNVETETYESSTDEPFYDETTNNNNSSDDIPLTGDKNTLSLFAAFVISAIGGITTLFMSKRHKTNR